MRDTGGVGSVRSVTYCACDVPYRGGGSDAECDKEAAREITVPEPFGHRNPPW